MQYILVHGLGHGGWCWDRTRAALQAAGHTVIAPDLPLTSLEDDVALVAALIDEHSPVVLVGHSYGGLVISQAAAGSQGTVSHLVYVAAAMFGPDEDYLALVEEHATPLSANLTERNGDWITVPAERARAGFYNECSAGDAAAAVARLRPTHAACISSGVTPAQPWQQIPSLFIVCLRDQAMPPMAQTVLAAKADRVIEMDTDHSPFLSDNEALCGILTSQLPTRAP